MEGIQTIQALKAVQSSLPAQTTIPSDELVMLYAADGTPIAKIARDDLVKAVASVMASNSQNTFSKLLGVQANGTPMGIGASDLASVLGGVYKININESIDLTTNQSVYLLINDNSRECYSNLHIYSVSNPYGGGYNNRTINFYVACLSGYSGYNSAHITPFDGNNDRQIEDYTYQGVTYKAIRISIDQYGKCTLCVIGNSSLAKIIV